MTGKQVRAQYTQEFKMEAVRQVRAGQAQSVVANVLCQYRLNFPHFGRLNFPHPWFAGDQPGWDACTSLGGRPGRRLAAGGSVGSNTEARLRMFSGISAACSRNRYELPSMGMTTA